jgi:TatD DNase family protein
MSDRFRLIDAHSHIHSPEFDGERDMLISRAQERGVGIFAIGTDYDSSVATIACAEKYEGVWAVIGQHPTDTDEEFVAEKYLALAKSSAKVVAIGECGLDYFRIPEGMSFETLRDVQLGRFRAQCEVAVQLGLPIMIHCRDAHADVMMVLQEFVDAGKPLAGNVHCFTGTPEEAARYVALGFYISFTGIVTFPPRKNVQPGQSAPSLDAAVLAVPIDRILVETDAPYLAPVPHRGEQNEPAFVEDTAKYIAQVRGLSEEEFMAQTVENTKRLFKLVW